MGDRCAVDVPVVIVGAGPTGLMLACLLGLYGIPCCLVERSSRASAVHYPRAVGIDADALRTFQRLGLADELARDMIPNSRLRLVSGRGKVLVDIQSKGRKYGWYNRNMFMQQLAEKILRKSLDSYPTVKFIDNTEVVGLENARAGAAGDAGAGVRVLLRGVSDGCESSVTTRFVVGADGAKSSVRRLVGLRLQGDTYANPWLILEVDNDPLDAPFSALHCDPERPYYTGRLPRGHRRFGIMLHPDETDTEVLSQGGLRRLLSPLVPSFDELNIIRAHVYSHQARLVDKMVRGSVTLVGDSAHLMPPWAGQGLNSGLRDVSNLSWKIAAIERGLCSMRLLESYHDERHQNSREAIEVSRRYGAFFLVTNRARARIRDIGLLSLRRIPVLREVFYDGYFSTPVKYRKGVLIKKGAGSGASVGTMFIQPHVELAGEIRLFDDVVGPWFSVVSYKFDAMNTLSASSAAFLKSLGAQLVRVDEARGKSEDHGASVVCAEDIYGELEDWFSSNAAEVVIIRPDRCVAAVGTKENLDEVCRQFEHLLQSF